MTTAADEALLAKLPDEVAAPMRRALALLEGAPPEKAAFEPDAYPGMKVTQSPSQEREADPLVQAAFEAARWPSYEEMVPVAAQLDPAQRALAELVASRTGVALHGFAIPQTAWARRRWLGIDPPGAAEREVDYEAQGEKRRAPLWRALAEHQDDHDAQWRILDALPLADRVAGYCEVTLGAYRFELPSWRDLAEIDASAAAWAPGFADFLAGLFAADAPRSERLGKSEPPWSVPWIVFLALARGRVPVEPRWDALLPTGWGDMASLAHECAAAIPEPRRGAALARALGNEFPRDAMRAGLGLVERFPSEPLVRHLVARADQAIESLLCPPRRAFLRELAGKLEAHPALRALVTARLDELPALPELHTARSFYVRSADELTPGLRTMLSVLGEGWETDDGPMVTKDGDEVTFGPIDFVSAFEIAGEDGAPAYEALLYMDEDGAVCVAGTTRSVAYVSQMNLSCNMGEELMEKLQELLRERPARREGDGESDGAGG